MSFTSIECGIVTISLPDDIKPEKAREVYEDISDIEMQAGLEKLYEAVRIERIRKAITGRTR